MKNIIVKYAVVNKQTPNNWSAYVPDCAAGGDAREETEQLICEANALHLDALRVHGDPIPRAGQWAELVEV